MRDDLKFKVENVLVCKLSLCDVQIAIGNEGNTILENTSYSHVN